MTTVTLPTTTRSRLTPSIVGGIAAVVLAVVTITFAVGLRDTTAPTVRPAPATAHVGSADALERRLTTAAEPGDFGSADAAEAWLGR